MPARRYRAVTYKRRNVRVPGGRTILRYKEKRAGVARCASCGHPLSGVPRARSSETHFLPRSSRMPNRPFGGNLCPACTRQAIKEAARA